MSDDIWGDKGIWLCVKYSVETSTYDLSVRMVVSIFNLDLVSRF